jgi:transcription elongation factor GreA
MSPAPTAAELLRSIGLDVDGPARWGNKPTSRKSGIFAVELAEPSEFIALDIDEIRRWLERVPELRMDGERPTQTALAERMRSFWMPGQSLLYVGRTAKSLSARVASLYATELGHNRPHPGGHWLKTLRDQPKLRLWWAETGAPEEYEDALIAAFAEQVPEQAKTKLPDGAPLLPWANLDSPTGPNRETGLANYLISVEVAATPKTNVKRSDTTARKRSATASSGGARTPKRTAAKPQPGSTPAASASATGPQKDAPTHVTAEGLAGLEAEMVRLTTVERPAVVERVKNARELGDLRENADYEAARNEQSFLEGHVLELEQRLRTAVVIEAGSGGAISMGSSVVYEVDGQRDELTIVGSTESDPAAGKISGVSPVGRSLLGHREGDEVVVVTPAAEIHYRIVEVK